MLSGFRLSVAILEVCPLEVIIAQASSCEKYSHHFDVVIMGLLTILKKVKEEEKEIRLLILGLDNAGKTSITKQFLGQPLDTVEPTLGFSIQTLDYVLGTSGGSVQNDFANAADQCVANGPRGSQSETDGGNNTHAKTELESKTKDTQHISADVDPTVFADNEQQQVYRLHLWDIGGQSSIRAYWRNYFEKTDGLIFVIDSSDKHRMEVVKEELSTLLQQERLQGATLLVLANKQDLKNALTAEEIATELELNSKIQYQNRHWAIYGCSAMTGEGLPQAMEWLVQDITSRIFLF